MKVLVLNGPSLNLLGTREPEIYGSETLADLEAKIGQWASAMGVDTECRQSNHEGELIDWIHSANKDAIVINPAAYTHTSRAIGDAITAKGLPTVEVHISNIKQREPWRAVSLVSDSCVRTIYGRGIVGYRHALRHLRNRAKCAATNHTYGPHEPNHGDLRGEGQHLFVLLHGGFWTQEWENDSMESLAVDLAERGHSSWNVEYRRIGNGGGWPGSFDDVLTAVDFAPHLRSDASEITLLGHSAGAHMALWAASRTSTPISQVIALSPATDLKAIAESGQFGSAENQTLLDAGAPREPDPGSVKTVVVHGLSDTHIPHEQSSQYTARRGYDLISPDTGHFQLLDPAQPYWAELVDSL